MAAIATPQMKKVESLVMISPNFGLADESAKWATRPFGRILTKIVAGDTRSWKAHNELQEKYWSTTYPMNAATEVIRLVDYVNEQLPLSIDQQLLVLVSPDDSVVSPAATHLAFEQVDTPRKQWVEITDAGDPSNHVLAGDILSPGNTSKVASLIVDFLRAGSVN